MDHILVVDDDAEIRQLLSDYLQKSGYQVSMAAEGRAMWHAFARAEFDLVILDVMLPGDDGLTLCRELRARSDVPIIMLTARGEEMDRIIGLELGADDYLPKPFNPRELLARIKVVLKRVRSLPPRTIPDTVSAYRFAGWTLDLKSRTLRHSNGHSQSLSGAEFPLLQIFCYYPTQVLSRDQILNLTQGRDTLPFERRIDVQISRLRKRLHDDGKEPKLIKTIRSAGYVLATEVETIS